MNLLIKQPTRRGYVEVVPFGSFDATYPHSLTRRGRVIGGRDSPDHQRHRDSTYLRIWPSEPTPSIERGQRVGGEIIDLRLSDYVQCIHSSIGHARLNMAILIIEYEDDNSI